MPAKTKRETEFGDFQTPDALARRVCAVARGLEPEPRAIVEPTCGKGSFLRAAAAAFPGRPRLLGFEINPEYARAAAAAAPRSEVRRADFFGQRWPQTFRELREPILVLGNPPWVTNAGIGALGGANLPAKSNARGLRGIDAITGKSNFDISEWMLQHLLESLADRRAALAMLCKTTTARKVLQRAWQRDLPLARAAVYAIDAAAHFGAAVDACLLACTLAPGASGRECAVYPTLEAKRPATTFALRSGALVADLDAADAYGHLAGASPLRWRSGIKHDCVQVMELRPKGSDGFENGLGEIVRLESTYLYPALKSSELMRPEPTPSRYMLVPQRTVGEDTARIARAAPRTWKYLQAHAGQLDGRASSIYRHRPRFSVFGVGPYSFAPWKLAVSGFYKRLEFRCVGPAGSRPVVLDDTCYFLPCRTERDARVLAELLNSEAARGFFRSFVFWDSKRPVTAQLLARLDLGRLAAEARVSLPTWEDASRQAPLL